MNLNVNSFHHMNVKPTSSPLGNNVQGNKAAVVDPHKSMLNSIEEIAARFSESTERREKRITDRKISSKPQFTIQSISEVIAVMGENNGRELSKKEETIIQIAKKSRDLDKLEKLVGGDHYLLDILLQSAIHKAGKSGDKSATENLESLLENNRYQNSKEINAGRNTALIISEYDGGLKEKSQLRSIYYQSVSKKQSAHELLSSLISEFGFEGFEKKFRTMLGSLSAEMASLSPSVGGSKLRRIMSDLQNSRTINAVLNGCNDLAKKMEAKRNA